MVGSMKKLTTRLQLKRRIHTSLRLLLAVGMLWGPAGRLAADELAATEEFVPFSENYTGAMLLNNTGTQFRIDHSEGPAVGRYDSLTGLEVFDSTPYGSGNLFLDARLLIDNDFHFGANLGVGHRTYVEEMNRIFGASLWFDVDDTNRNEFYQWVLSLETFGEHFDALMNFYLPVGDTEQTYGFSPYTSRFTGTSLLLDRTRFDEVALTGLEGEVGTPLPGGIGEAYNIRGYAGLYHFAGDGVPDLLGVSGRVEARVRQDLSLRVSITNDDVFNTHVVFGGTYYFPSGRSINNISPNLSVYDRLEERVHRRYHAIVANAAVSESSLAINPETGLPFNVIHVNSEANAGGNGAVNTPFQTLAAASAASSSGSIIFAHADSSFDGEQITLQSNQQLLGEADGITHVVNVGGMGMVALPRATSGSAMPEITNAPGFAIALGNNSTVSGFDIEDASGPGIFAENVTGNVRVTNTMIESTTGAGVNLVNSSANFDFANTSIDSNGTGNAFAVAGGTANINFDGDITNLNGGRMLSVSNTTGGVLNFGGDLDDSSGQGILIDNADGDVNIVGATINSSNSTGIDVRNSGGNIQFNDTTITKASTDAVSLTNNSGIVTFTDLALTNSGGGRGIFASNNSGELNFLGTNQVAVTGGAAIDIAGSNVDATFASISATTSTGNGISLNNVDGSFTVTGETTLGSITNTAFLVQNGSVDVMLDTLSIDGAANGLTVQNTSGSFILGDALASTGGGTIEDIGNRGVQLTNAANVSLHSLSIDMSGVAGTNDAIEINQTNANDSTILLSDLNVSGTESEGLDINANGTGTLHVGITGSNIAADFDALNASTGGAGANLELALSDVVLQSTDRAGARIDGSAGGTLTVTEFADIRVEGSATGNGGALFDSVVFDADTQMAGIQQVNGGDSRFGTIGNRIIGDGLRLDQVSGELAFGALDIFNDGGTGLYIRNAAPDEFTFGNTGGSVNTVNGTALDLDPVTLDSTFASITSNNSVGSGIILDAVSGNFTVTGATTITGADTAGIQIANITDAATIINFGTVDITSGDTFGIQFANVAGTVNFGDTTIGAPAVGSDSGVLMTSSSGAVEFANLDITDGGVNLLNSTGSFTVNGGSIDTSLGRAIDIQLGSIDAVFTDTQISADSGASAVSVALVSGGSLTIDGSSIVTASNLAAGMSGIAINAAGSDFVSSISAALINGGGNGTGISVQNLGSGGSATFGTTLSNNVVTGYSLQNSAGDISFENASVNGAVDGLVAQNMTGALTIGANGVALGNGGNMQNLTGDGIRLLNTSSASFQFMNIDASGGNSALAATVDGTNGMDLLFSNNDILGAGAEGIDLNNLGTGTLNATVNDNAILSTGDSFNAELTTATGGMGLNLNNNAASGAFELNSGLGTIQLGGPVGLEGTGFLNSDNGALDANGNTTGGLAPTVNATGDFDVVNPATIPTP